MNSSTLPLGITFGNLWVWRIFKDNFIIGILSVILSLLLFKQVITKVQKGQLIALIFIFIIVAYLTLRVGFDKNISIISAEEQLQQNSRHGFYAVELGQLFKNKVSLSSKAF